MANNKRTWDAAARAGLALGGVSAVYFALNSLLSTHGADWIGSIGSSLIILVLWGFKFYLCIALLKRFMKQFAAQDPEVTNSDTLRLGVCTALLSSLVYSAIYLAWVLFVQPDIFVNAMQSVAANLPPDALSQMQDMIGKMPQYTFWANLIYCFLFGTVLSAILSRNIPSQNPFEKQEEEEQ
jgi:hypothetical protein